MEAIFDYAGKTEPDVSCIRRLFLNTLLNLYWSHLEDADRRVFSIDKIIEVTHCTDIGQLETKVLTQAEEILRVLIGKQKKYSEAVFLIMQYMEERYADSITLDELANHVHMNRSYISHLFKKETGRNINTCIKVPNKLQKDQNIFKICKRYCENKIENSKKDTKRQT